jgi:hypothetical protein
MTDCAATSLDHPPSKIVVVTAAVFWLHGGTAEANIHVYRDISAAVNLTGSHASNIGPGVDVSQIAVMAGPRYTYRTSRWTDRWFGDRYHTSVFGEALFGGVHAFEGAFPYSGGIKGNATALSIQVGDGLDVRLSQAFALRAIKVD